MKHRLLSATMDYIFKLIFGDEKHADVLAAFLMAVLGLPTEEFDSLQILNPFLEREAEDDKLGILDVKLKLRNGKVIDIEIQVKPLPSLEGRVVFYIGRMVTEQIASGDGYEVIKPVVTILIADFIHYQDDAAYHHKFELYDCGNDVLFSDLIGVHVLELPKLPDADDDTDLWEWLRFLKSDDEEELHMLAQRNPALERAVGIRLELSQDEKVRMIAEAREKARRDEADRIAGARNEGIRLGRDEGIRLGRDEGSLAGRLEIARRMASRGRPLAEIMEDTGLTAEEVSGLEV
ncbi:MAG: Rpn family recombination-promoting nuclease/putative transposase [Clostridium sp.]|jgi:predicted transposase/invertase (TIGR01784 family)|nr:Rpn family recombination-promoting nuclease/putative transposase [Clostridium sp.]